jgi:hypothetical protein
MIIIFSSLNFFRHAINENVSFFNSLISLATLWDISKEKLPYFGLCKLPMTHSCDRIDFHLEVLAKKGLKFALPSGKSLKIEKSKVEKSEKGGLRIKQIFVSF